jgi:hypothetical protein
VGWFRPLDEAPFRGVFHVDATAVNQAASRLLGVDSSCLLSEVRMRISEFRSLILVFTGLLLGGPAVAQKQLAQSPRILSAKTVCFNNQTGSDAVA